MKRNWGTFIAILFIEVCLIFTTAGAQSKQQWIQPGYVFKNWNNQKGLPQNTVDDIVRDEEGYLWLATDEGLVRFDGNNFKTISKENTPELISNSFIDLTISATGGLWAASDNSVVRVNKNKVRAFDFRKLLGTGNRITRISESAKGILWVGTNTGKIFYVQNHAISKYIGWKYEGIKNIQVLQAVSDGLFIGTEKGMFKLREDNRQIVAVAGLETNNIRAIALGKDGSMWIGTKEGLFKTTQQKVTHFTERDGLVELFITCLAIAPNGNIWIGTANSGIQLYANEQFTSIPANGFSIEAIRSISCTGKNLVWVGTPGSGLFRLKPAEVLTLKNDAGLSGKVILPIYQHSNGDIWIGTAGKGISRLRQDKVTHYTRKEGLSSNLSLSIYGTEEAIYIGTDKGLNRFNLQTEKMDLTYTVKDGLASDIVPAVFMDSKQRLWIATRSGGVHTLEKGKIQRIALPAKFATAEFTSFFEDHDNNIWVGSNGSGLLRINSKGDIYHYSINKELSSDIIYGFHQDKKGILWIGSEGGLISFVNNEFKLYDKSNGLHFIGIYRIIGDEAGNLWLTGDMGLQLLTRHELDKLAGTTNKDHQLKARLFGTNDGMTNAEMNGNIFPAGWKMNDGSIWFPTVEGVAVVQPGLINSGREPMNVHIQSLQFGEEQKYQLADIKVPPGVYTISVNYTSIDFTNPQAIHYYYRLKGLSDKWENAGNRQIAYFTSLNPGDYVFEVKAELNGEWSPSATIQFTVAPFFYQEWWFKALLLLLLFTAGLFVNQLYNKSREKAYLTKLVAERTKELEVSHLLFSDLFDLNPVALAINSFENGEIGKILKVNAAFLSLFEFTDKEEVIGKTAIELNLVPSSQQLDNIASKVSDLNMMKDLEVNVVTKHGKILWLSTSVLLLDIDNTPSLFSASLDITQRKNSEEEIKKYAEELRVSNAELERFAHLASHDLQEPLRMVNSFMNLLARRLDGQLDDTSKQYIGFAVDGAQRMKTLVQDLLTYSRVGTNKEEFALTDLNDVMMYTSRVLEEEVMKNGVELTVSPMPVIVANKTLITQLFVNLVSNALKYHRDKEAKIEVGFFEDQIKYTFYVKDNGIGIDSKYFEMIFVIFQRLHSKSEYSGNGIGLAICKKIVETHKGEIWVDSEPGQGSTFYFTIPKPLGSRS